MQERPSGLRPGDRVVARCELWRIGSIAHFADCEELALVGTGPANHGLTRRLLYPFDRPLRVARRARLRVVKKRRWMRALAAEAGNAHPYGSLRTAATARMALYTHQLEPALAVARGETRLLIADEVGLGKTVQAGLILSELQAGHEAERALILTPPPLRDQWAEELARRFGIAPVVADAAYLRRAAIELPPGVNPWAVQNVYIASTDFIKRAEVIQGLESLVWDLLVVDEAHTAATARERGAAVRAIGRWARRVVLLTATPHAGDETAFRALCDLGRTEPDEALEPPILLFRRSRRDAGLPSGRRVSLLAVRPTPEERRMHRLLERYAREVWREAARDRRDALLALAVLVKRALSSAGSLALSVDRRLRWLAAVPDPAGLQLGLPIGAQAEPDEMAADEAPDLALAAPGLTRRQRELDLLEQLLNAARAAAGAESKLAALGRLLRRTAEPVIVFTEFRDTLARIAAAAAAADGVALLHGGLSDEERRAALTRLSRGDARVLLATDAAGQGLNLQARCRWIVNYELPWNPMRLEQRIGRVDRLGQTRRVHAIHLLARDTAETGILTRLIVRLERIRSSLGALDTVLGTPTEQAITQAILSGDLQALAGHVARPQRPPPSEDLTAARHPPFTTEDLRHEAAAEHRRLEQARRLCNGGRTRPGATGARTGATGTAIGLSSIAARGRSLGLRGCIVCLFHATLVDPAGRLLEEHIVPIALAMPRLPRLASCRDIRTLAGAILSSSGRELSGTARRAALRRARQIEPGHREWIVRMRARELALLKSLRVPLSEMLVQPGLFDRRALSFAERRRQTLAATEASMRRRLATLDPVCIVSPGEDPELTLVLILT